MLQFRCTVAIRRASMAELPADIVTFLFTDIEGSTLLWESHPTAAKAAQLRHDQIIEARVSQAGGTVVRPRGEGDSRFVVFNRATDAVAAADAIQHAFDAEPWQTPSPLRVRIALHTGEADLRGGEYYGAAVNRCARLRAAAYGGQTLVSLTTAQLVRDDLPDGVTLLDLGEHRLKDLTYPEHIYQLVSAGLQAEFPPIKTLDGRSDTALANLPTTVTSFIGRDNEVAAVHARLMRPDVRVITLTGPGGTGKTRLSLELAAHV